MRDNRGFTLIEIMIVVAILAIISAVAIPNFFAYVHRSRVNLCVSNLEMLNRATEVYLIEHSELSLDSEITLSMLAAPDGATVSERKKYFVKSLPKCPAGGVYSYDTHKHCWVCSVGDVGE